MTILHLIIYRAILVYALSYFREGYSSQSWAENIFFDIIFVFRVNICLWVVGKKHERATSLPDISTTANLLL